MGGGVGGSVTSARWPSYIRCSRKAIKPRLVASIYHITMILLMVAVGMISRKVENRKRQRTKQTFVRPWSVVQNALESVNIVIILQEIEGTRTSYKTNGAG